MTLKFFLHSAGLGLFEGLVCFSELTLKKFKINGFLDFCSVFKNFVLQCNLKLKKEAKINFVGIISLLYPFDAALFQKF